jgi:glucose-1-phosphate thymidylyltransferase
MKALITAGGHATRLRPVTQTINKHLIPIANKPMIFYALEKVAEIGIKEVGIIINPGDENFQKAVGNGEKFDVKITYIEQKGGPLGLGHVIKMSQGFLGDEPFLFYLGDNILLNSLAHLKKSFEEKKANCLLALSRVNDPQRFGVPDIQNGKIVKVDEKPEKPKSDFAVTGVYFYDSSIFKAVENLKPSARGELEISDAHTYLIDHGYKVEYEEITGWWKDTGKPQDLLEANQLVLAALSKSSRRGEIEAGVTIQGPVDIGAGTKIMGRNTIIRGPVIIGGNCYVENSYIGPYTTVGDKVEIYNSEIENSIVLEFTDINCGKRIVDSLIGKNCQITSASKTFPNGHKLVIGDQSLIEL